MFNTLKGKFQVVQDGISAGIRSLALKDDRKTDVEISSVNFDAGGDILAENRSTWIALHTQAESNAKKAQELDEKIAKSRSNAKSCLDDMRAVNNLVSIIPELVKKSQDILKQVDKFEESSAKIEELLMHFEDGVEQLELQQQKVNLRFEFTYYIDKKMKELDKFKEKRAVEYAEKLAILDKKAKENLKDRQDLFNIAIQQDLQLYKESGVLPRVKTNNPECKLSLEDIIIEDDMEDLNNLLEN